MVYLYQIRNGMLKEIKEFLRDAVYLRWMSSWSFFPRAPRPENNNDINLQSCEGELTLDGGYQALTPICNDNSWGSDCLPANFYKTFWNSIGLLVLESLNCRYRKGLLSTEQTRRTVTLILKSNIRLPPLYKKLSCYHTLEYGLQIWCKGYCF